jgi:hypothetical protein
LYQVYLFIIIPTTKNSITLNNESLVNTNSSLDSTSNIQLVNLPNHDYVNVSIQTEANTQVEASIQTANSYVNTGMQTSSRMWFESIRNWINELLSTPNPQGQYVDVEVQTNTISTFQIVKQWFLEVCSIRSSELSSMGYNKVEKWRNNIDSNQSVDLHDSESPLIMNGFTETPSTLETLGNLVVPDKSASQISEVISESNLQEVRIYDMNNADDVLSLMNDPTVVCFNSAVEGNLDDELLTFVTVDSAYDILRSTLETLLTSVN